MSSSTYGAIKLATAEDVGAVLKKKMGTQTGFKPKEWADTINLLGKLPTKTATGAIAHFADGADDVPCVSVVANIVPYQEGTGDPSQNNKRPIHGYTSCTTTQTRKNLLDPQLLEGYWDSSTGEFVSNSTWRASKKIKCKPNTTYVMSGTTYTTGGYSGRSLFWDESGNYLGYRGTGANFTSYPNSAYMAMYTGANYITSQMQIEEGTTATTYEAYKSETYTTEMPVMKNLFTGSWEDKTVNESRPIGTTYANMKIASATRKTTAELLRLPSAPFVFSCSSDYDLFLTFYDEGGLYIGQYKSWADSKVITSTDAKYVGVTFRKSNNQTLTADDEKTVHIQLEEGSTATSYEPYRTVFVGTLDLVSGLLTITHRFQALDALGWNKNGSTITFYSETLTGLQGETDDFYCSCYLPTENGGYNGQNGKMSIKTSSGTSRIWVADNSYSTSADFKASLSGQTAVLKLSTPIEVQLTPEEVRTFLGVNNIWANTGDTEVEYRADIDLLLTSLQGNRGLQMTRSASPVEEEQTEEVEENEDER